MADIISRLKLESGEFDSKIKRAGQELLAYSEHCKKFSLQMGFANKDAVEFAKQLGSMATTSTTARGKINELSEAFVNLKVMYNNMTEKEKEHPFGKNLAASLDQLKGRINDAKNELSDINKELGNTGKQSEETGGLLNSLSQKFGINAKQLLGWGSALLAAKGYMGLVTDAIHQNEEATDVWEQTVRAGSTTYDAFVNALNTGDFAGFFSSINDIVDAATRAAKALDDLKTKGGIISNYEARLNAERAELLKIIKDPKSTQEEVADAQRRLKVNQSHRGKAAQETADLNNEYIRSALWERARSQGMTKAEFKKYYRDIVSSLYDTSAFDRLGKINIKRNKAFALDEMGHALPGTDSYTINLGSVFTDEFRDSLNPFIQAYWNAQSNQYNQERADNRLAGGGRSGRGGGRGGGRKNPPPYKPQTQVLLFGIDNIPWWQKKNALPEMEKGIQGSMGMIDINPAIQMQSASWVQRGQKNPELTKIADTMDESAKLFSDINGGISSIVTGVETLGIEVPEGMKKMLSMVQGVTTILSGISSLMLIFNAHQTANTLSNIASVVGAAAMHRGGVVRAATGTTVPGNYGFDAVPALLTSGETVLTRAQAGNIASQLQQGSKTAGTPQARVSGEQIYLVLTNYLKRRGQGETLTF